MEKKGGSLSGGRGLALCIILFAIAGYLTYRTLFTAGRPVPQPLNATFMCSETGMVFEYAMHEGEGWPVLSPFSNKKTGYPVERCYWTKDGKRKATPTYVILNEHMGKPGDTFCLDCGKLVVGHNPPPPPDTPLALPSSAATKAAPGSPAAPGAAKPVQPPGEMKAPPPVALPTAAPGASQPGTVPVSSLPKVTPQSAEEQAKAERGLYATIRAKMEEMIRERARFLQSGKDSSDPQVRQFEESILKARQLLIDHGEAVPEIVPPISPPTTPGK